ncbi:hypothetical protein ACRRTK_002410 [Alexandromys fortis]
MSFSAVLRAEAHIPQLLVSPKHFELSNGAQRQELSAAFPGLVTGLLNCLHLFPMELQCCSQKWE